MDSRQITQAFGAHPEIYGPLGLPGGHEGADLRAPMGANVYAAAAGVVTEVILPTVPYDPVTKKDPYGKHVRIKHNAGGQLCKTVYAHLQAALVNVGDTVTAGQLIGRSDATGNVRPTGAAGSHVHFGLYFVDEQGNRLNADNGYRGYQDPMLYLVA